MTGEVQPLDISPRAKGYQGMWKRVPIGPCSFISPFNFPLNLAAHKIAPALAVGCPFVMKPASRTPLGAIIIGEVLAETDLPKGAFSILPAHRDGRRPVHHRRPAEAAVLHRLARRGLGPEGPGRQEEGGAGAGRQRRGDRRPRRRPGRRGRADHLRRLLPVRPVLHRRAADHHPRRASTTSCATGWWRKTKALIAGDPKDETTFIGPMIDEKEASRLDGWIQEAVAERRDPAVRRRAARARCCEATLLENVAARLQAVRDEEAFGPVAILSKFTDFEAALDEVNDSQVRPAGRRLHPRPGARC